LLIYIYKPDIFCEHSIWDQKHRISADFESVKKLQSITGQKLFHSVIFQLFSMDSKWAFIIVIIFWYPYWLEQYYTVVVLILSLFVNFEAKITTWKGSKRCLLWTCLKINFTYIHRRFVMLNFVKKSKNQCTLQVDCTFFPMHLFYRRYVSKP
jgi:hypothetical protein